VHYLSFVKRPAAIATMVVALLAGSAAHAQDEATLSLADAIHLAHASSPDLRAAAARTARADAEHDAAIAGYLPRVSATVSGTGAYLRDTLPPIREPFTLEPYTIRSGAGEGRAELRWTVWDFGRTSSAAHAAVARREAGEHDEAAAKATLTKNVARFFFQVVFDEDVVASKKSSLDKRARHAAIAKALVERGVRTPLDEVRARLSLEAARHDLALAEAHLASDRARLAGTLGVETLGRLARAKLSVTDGSPRAAAKHAESDRPEVASASAEVRARDEAVDAARAQYLPSIGLTVGASYRLTRYLDVGRDMIPRNDVSGALVVSIPIFDAHTIATVATAQADLAASRARQEKVRRDVRTEAEVATIELRSGRELLARAKELSASAHATLTVMEARYQSGLATPLELVDAESSDVDAREAVLAAELRLAVAMVETAVATGRSAMLEAR